MFKKMSKKVLIFGVNGQDGKLLSEYLLKKNYKIIGTHYKSIKIKILQLLSLILMISKSFIFN